MQKEKKVRNSVIMPKYAWEQLRKESIKQGISMSMLILLAIQEKYGIKNEN